MAKALAGDDGRTVLYSRMKVDRGVDRYWIRPDRGIREGEDVGEYLFCANQFMQTSTMVVPTGMAQHVLFDPRSEEHTSELQSLMRTSYAAFCSKERSTYTIFTTRSAARSDRKNNSLNSTHKV